VGTFSASFEVTAVNVTRVDRDESRATVSNFENALAEAQDPLNDTFGDGDEGFAFDTFLYSGPLRFGTDGGASTTIGNFLNTGVSNGGVLTDLDPTFASLTNSAGGIDQTPGVATTTFYLFRALAADFSAGLFDIAHDDGVRIPGLPGVAGPITETGTRIAFGGGPLAFLYVSSNSDPSVFRVDSSVRPVPLPAGIWMLLVGAGAFGLLARRRKAAA
jgi:hypothetical protein